MGKRENQQCGFRTGPTQTSLYSQRSRLEACNFGFKKKRNCTIRVAKTKAQRCLFFAYADCWFSGAAHFMLIKYERSKMPRFRDGHEPLELNYKLMCGLQ